MLARDAAPLSMRSLAQVNLYASGCFYVLVGVICDQSITSAQSNMGCKETHPNQFLTSGDTTRVMLCTDQDLLNRPR
jgi:hypothetical protein